MVFCLLTQKCAVDRCGMFCRLICHNITTGNEAIEFFMGLMKYRRGTKDCDMVEVRVIVRIKTNYLY